MSKRGTSVRLLGVPRSLRIKFQRAVALSGAPSQSSFLSSMVRRTVLDAEQRHGDLLNVLTPEEADIVQVVTSGAAEIQQIIEETLLSAKKVEQLLDGLVERKVLEIRKKGGKTEGARGAVVKLYFVTGSN